MNGRSVHNQTVHNQAVLKIADDFKNKGYLVVVDPNPSTIPFELDNYHPDILAIGNSENLMIEVKTSKNPRSVERYQKIVETVKKQQDWRFMLVTIDTEDVIHDTSDFSIKDTNHLVSAFNRISGLLDDNNYALALPYLWTIYTSSLRFLGERASIPVDATSDRSVLNYLYSLGEISIEEFDAARQFMKLRNTVIHNLSLDNVSKPEVMQFCNMVKEKLNELQS